MTTRAEAIARLRMLPDGVRPGLPYDVGAFVPNDAQGVAALFHTVYGDAYPVDLYYIPEAIRQACDRGDLHPVVARLAGGEVIGFTALYRSSPPFAGLMEFGLGAVHPAYRGSFVLFHLFSAAMARLEALPGVQAVFGEAVCDTIITQHASSLFGFRETAIELGLMPEKIPGAGRTACLVMFRNARDTRRALHHTACCARHVERLVAEAGLDRELVLVDAASRDEEPTRIETQLFASAGVLRANVFSLGDDGQEALRKTEERAWAEGCRVCQLFLDTSRPGVAAAIPFLRLAGYGLGGLLPRWFDSDALLLQKLLDPPDLDRIQLYSDSARAILAMALEGSG